MRVRVFVSLAKVDKDLAFALRTLFSEVFAETVQVSFAGNSAHGDGIPPGEDWFKWTLAQVRDCDCALVLVTPASIRNPWVLWEAGAICGAAANSEPGGRKVRPLLFGIEPEHIPPPIEKSHAQATRGDDAEEMKGLLIEFYKTHQAKLEPSPVVDRLPDLMTFIELYLERVKRVFAQEDRRRADGGDHAGLPFLGRFLDFLTAPELMHQLRKIEDLERQNGIKLDELLRRLPNLADAPRPDPVASVEVPRLPLASESRDDR